MRFLCPKGTYNELATLVFSTEGGIIRFLLKAPILIRDQRNMENMDVPSILIFCFVWIFLTFITYGVVVPSGLFLPGIIIGCCFGLLFLQMMLSLGYSIWTVGG